MSSSLYRQRELASLNASFSTPYSGFLSHITEVILFSRALLFEMMPWSRLQLAEKLAEKNFKLSSEDSVDFFCSLQNTRPRILRSEEGNFDYF